MSRRVRDFLRQLNGPLELCYDFKLDWRHLVSLIERDAELMARVKPVDVAGPKELTEAAQAALASFKRQGLGMHHALVDASVLRAQFQSLVEPGQTEPDGLSSEQKRHLALLILDADNVGEVCLKFSHSLEALHRHEAIPVYALAIRAAKASLKATHLSPSVGLGVHDEFDKARAMLLRAVDRVRAYKDAPPSWLTAGRPRLEELWTTLGAALQPLQKVHDQNDGEHAHALSEELFKGVAAACGECAKELKPDTDWRPFLDSESTAAFASLVKDTAIVVSELRNVQTEGVSGLSQASRQGWERAKTRAARYRNAPPAWLSFVHPSAKHLYDSLGALGHQVFSKSPEMLEHTEAGVHAERLDALLRVVEDSCWPHYLTMERTPQVALPRDNPIWAHKNSINRPW